MQSKAWAVIYCPKEGTLKTKRRWKKIRHSLEQSGVAFDYVQSEGPGAVERLASMMTRSGYGTIVIVGGDGALNHALCGVMDTCMPGTGRPVLGVIPNGFGNDFARYWGFSYDDYKGCISKLLVQRKRKVDVGVVKINCKDGDCETLYFLNCVNLGIASSITSLKRKTGSFFGLKTISYLTSSLLLLFERTSFNFTLKMSGIVERRKAMTLCIGSAHGYGLTPSAVPYNGMLDVTMVTKSPLSQMFHGLWLLFTGRFLSHRGVRVWRTNHIQVQTPDHALLSIDGRTYHREVESLDVTIRQEYIDFLIP